MSEMVKRVARAIWQSQVDAGECLTPEPLTEEVSEILERWARSAIASMREPTLPMVISAGYLAHDEAWRAMIDEALK